MHAALDRRPRGDRMAVEPDALVGGRQQHRRHEAASAAGRGELRRRLVLGDARSNGARRLGERGGEVRPDLAQACKRVGVEHGAAAPRGPRSGPCAGRQLDVGAERRVADQLPRARRPAPRATGTRPRRSRARPRRACAAPRSLRARMHSRSAVTSTSATPSGETYSTRLLPPPAYQAKFSGRRKQHGGDPLPLHQLPQAGAPAPGPSMLARPSPARYIAIVGGGPGSRARLRPSRPLTRSRARPVTGKISTDSRPAPIRAAPSAALDQAELLPDRRGGDDEGQRGGLKEPGDRRAACVEQRGGRSGPARRAPAAARPGRSAPSPRSRRWPPERRGRSGRRWSRRRPG